MANAKGICAVAGALCFAGAWMCNPHEFMCLGVLCLVAMKIRFKGELR